MQRVLILRKRGRLTISGRDDVQTKAPELMIESILVPLMHPRKESWLLLSRARATLHRGDAQIPAECVGDDVEDGLRDGREDADHVGFR